MKRVSQSIWAVITSRALTPIVFGIFLLLYIGIAFSTEDALIALINIARTSMILIFLFALIPLNSALQLLKEIHGYLVRRRILHGREVDRAAGLFDETVELSSTPPSFADLQNRLAAAGYKTDRAEGRLTAWRGVSAFPARILYLTGTFCLFAGILISLSTRDSYRGTIIEGEPIPSPTGDAGNEVRIRLENATSRIYSKYLAIEVIPSRSGEEKKVFGLYPPSRYQGTFVYPRYLGIGLFVRFAAPDMPAGYETHAILNIHPAGKEDSVQIPGSPYRIVFSMAESEDGNDPYITGRISILFKLLKGKDILFSGSAPAGGEYAKDGYRLSFPDLRRLVITDFISDNGVILVWASGLFFIVAVCTWLPLRIFSPRSEMLFVYEAGIIHAFSNAEGGNRKHAGAFHESLDLLEARRLAVT